MKMKKLAVLCCAVLVGAGLVAGCGSSSKGGSSSASKEVTLNVATAGDTNMEELQTKNVAPLAAEKLPGVKLNVVGAGPGDDGSRKIFEKLKAQKEANKEKWDVDVAIVHQSIMNDMIKEGLLDKYVPLTNAKDNLTNVAAAKNSLGTDVEGYVIPLFMSQTAIAYNSKTVSDPPKTMQDLESWIKAHPNKFGYNGVKGGMAGVSFVGSYLYYKSPKADQIMKGPYDKAVESDWNNIMTELKALPVTATNGNQGTLDMLNRGEIDMGPVWVDMFYTMQSQGRMSPDVRLTLPAPGMPGQPMYVVVPAKAANKDAAVKFAELLGSPEVQAKVIVDKYNWYPGIDAAKVFPLTSDKAKNSLFKDLTPEILAKNGKPFPLAQYMKDMLEAYENAK